MCETPSIQIRHFQTQLRNMSLTRTHTSRATSDAPIFFVPNSGAAVMPFSEVGATAAIDVSGSTAGAILVDQTRTAALLGPQSFFPWESKCADPKRWSDGVVLRAQGGTVPSAIFAHAAAAAEVAKAGGFILMTDGEIEQREVERLSAHVSKVAHKPVVLLITIGGGRTPHSVNVSVAAAFLAACADCVLCVRTVAFAAGDVAVLRARGAFAHLGRTADIAEHTRWDQLDHVSIEALRSVEVCLRQAMPAGVVSLGSRFVHLPTLLDAPAGALAEDELAALLEARADLMLACKTSNKIADLRRFLHRHAACSPAAPAPASAEDTETTELFQRVVHLLASDPQAAELPELRRRLCAVQARRTRDGDAAQRNAAAGTRDVRALIQDALAQLGEVERGGYGADVLGRLSNRAMRTTVVSADALAAASALDTAGAFRGECMVCADDGVLALALRHVQAVTLNTADAALTFPLAAAVEGHNRVLLPDLLCVACAERQHRTSARSVLTREAVVCVVPLVSLANAANRNDLLARLALALAGGLQVASLPQLMLGIVQHEMDTCGFAADGTAMRDALQFLGRQLLDHTTCPVTLREGGARATLRTALVQALDSPLADNYALAGLCVWLRVLAQFGLGGPVDGGRTVVRRRLLRALVAEHLGALHPARVSTLDARVLRYDALLYGQTRFGVPVDGTARQTTAVGDLLDGEDRRVLEALVRAQFGAASLEAFAHAPSVSAVLNALRGVRQHDSLGNTVSRLCREDALAASAFSAAHELALDAAAVVAALNARVHFTVDALHSARVAPFATPLGPSCLGCALCGFRFVELGFRGTPAQVRDRVVAQRSAHFAEVFAAAPNGSGAPCPGSGHVCLHLAVRTTFDGALDEEAQVARTVHWIVREDCRGNIWCAELEQDVRACIADYRRVLAQTAGHVPARSSVLAKLALELKQDERAGTWHVNI